MIIFLRGMTLPIDEAATSGHKAVRRDSWCSLFEPRRTEYVTDGSWLMSYVVAFSDGAVRDDAAILIARCT